MQARSCLPMTRAGFWICERPVTQDRDSAGLSIKACFKEFDEFQSMSLSEHIADNYLRHSLLLIPALSKAEELTRNLFTEEQSLLTTMQLSLAADDQIGGMEPILTWRQRWCVVSKSCLPCIPSTLYASTVAFRH